MKRKIIKLAEKTLVVSLPHAWTTALDLEKGAELDCELDGNRIIYSSAGTSQEHRHIELDVQGITERVLRWKISSYHKQGYDEITLTNYTPEQYAIVEELTRTLFIGFIVKEKTKLRVVVGQVAQVEVGEFDGTLRRAFRHLQQMGRELHDAFTTQDAALLAGQLLHEQSNNRMTNFCERLLNRSLLQKEKGHFWYVIAWNLEKVADTFKYIAQYYAKEPKISKASLELLSETLDYLDGYAQLLYAFSFSELVRLSAQKKELEAQALQLLEQGIDSVFCHYLHTLILQLADFSASSIALKA